MSLNDKESGYLKTVLLFKINTLRHRDDWWLSQDPRKSQGVFEIKTQDFLEWGLLRPRAYRLHMFIPTDIRNRKRIALYVCECHKSYKASSPSLVCQGFFFYGPNWSLSPKGFWIMQVSQVLTSHPQHSCAMEMFHGKVFTSLSARPWLLLGETRTQECRFGAISENSGLFLPPSSSQLPSRSCWQEGLVTAQDSPCKLMNSQCLSFSVLLSLPQLPRFVFYWGEHLVLAGGGLGKNIF